MKEHVRELLSPYVDDEVTNEERSLVETHLQDCAECRAFMEDLTRMRSAIFTAYHSIEIPDSIEQHVVAAIQTNTTVLQPAQIKASRYGLAAFVAFLLLSLLGLSPLGLFGLGFLASMLHLFIRLLQVLSTLLGTVPFLVEGISVFSVAVLTVSAWFLRRLLMMEKMV